MNYCRQAKIKGNGGWVGIESNREPRLDDSSNSSSASAAFEKSSFRNKFSIDHIQSLSNRVDLIEFELRSFDAICLAETWLDRRTSVSSVMSALASRDKGIGINPKLRQGKIFGVRTCIHS